MAKPTWGQLAPEVYAVLDSQPRAVARDWQCPSCLTMVAKDRGMQCACGASTPEHLEVVLDFAEALAKLCLSRGHPGQEGPCQGCSAPIKLWQFAEWPKMKASYRLYKMGAGGFREDQAFDLFAIQFFKGHEKKDAAP
jgi:hypothetical protein